MLGNVQDLDSNVPVPINTSAILCDGNRIDDLVAGPYHVIVKDINGKFFSLGHNEFGQVCFLNRFFFFYFFFILLFFHAVWK